MVNIDLTIVLPTLGRSKEVNAMLASIFRYPVEKKYNIEIVIVDQNFSDLLNPIVERYINNNKHITIDHHKVSFRGLSKAKNYGTTQAHGRYVCFIDDDAEFTEGLINQALNRLESDDFDIVSGRCIDRIGNNSVLNFKNEEAVLTLNAFENRFVESTMFFKHEICVRFPYDENMGLGAFYGAEEGYDLVFRMLHAEVKILFDPEIKFYHPQTLVSHSAPGIARKAFSYRIGYGYLCKKHNLRKKYWKRLVSVICYIPYLCLMRPKDVRFYFGELLGLLVGRYL